MNAPRGGGDPDFPPSHREPDALLPLTPVVYEILVSLGDEERHGYGIMQEIEARTGRSVNLQPGTLYRAVDRMLGLGLIEESDARPDPEFDDERRRYEVAGDLLMPGRATRCVAPA